MSSGASPAPASPELYRRLAELYRDQSPLVRWYVHCRARYYPLATCFKHLPPRGNIIDMGCGDGVLTLLLALQLPEATIVGYDPNCRRLVHARRASAGLKNVSFIESDWMNARCGPFDAMVLVDVLHHVSYAEQAAMLRSCVAGLKPSGVVVINETDPSTPVRWRYWWNYLSDVLLYPTSERCQFRTPTQMTVMLQDAGLRIQIQPLNGAFGFSTIAYIGTKL